jgi:hypothetical protein
MQTTPYCGLYYTALVRDRGRIWLATDRPTSTTSMVAALFSVYTWSGSSWKLEGRVRGSIGPGGCCGITPLVVPGTRHPGFALISGMPGAVPVVSDVGGTWHDKWFLTLRGHGLRALRG